MFTNLNRTGGLSVAPWTLFLAISGCGTYIPEINERWDSTTSPILSTGGTLEYKIKQKIYCSIIEAVRANSSKLPKGMGSSDDYRSSSR
jgi:hypothetical protein